MTGWLLALGVELYVGLVVFLALTVRDNHRFAVRDRAQIRGRR